MIPGLGRSTGEGMGYPLQYSWASLVAQLVKNCLQCRRPGFIPWVGKTPCRRESLPTPVFWPREFNGLYSPWGRKESEMTEQLSLSNFLGFLTICNTDNPIRSHHFLYCSSLVVARHIFQSCLFLECLMSYGMRFVTLYRRQGSRPSPWKRNAKKQNGCLGRPYK